MSTADTIEVKCEDRIIGVLVNEQRVELEGREHTGREIKTAAIAQHVAIQLDFVLSIEQGAGKTHIVGDNEVVKVHPHERFVAVADDDNS